MSKIWWTKEQCQWLIENYPKYGSDYCSEYLNIDRNIIQYKSSKLGIRLNKDCLSDIFKKRCCNYYDKHEYKEFANGFINFQTPYHVYILGLIWADGHVSKETNLVTLSMVLEDFNVIKWIFDKVGNWNIVYRNHTNHPTWKPAVNVRVSNKFFADFLKDCNYLNKSGGSPNKILSLIPNNLYNYWWRGYFDGDGHVSYKKHHIDFSSVIEQDWGFLCELLTKLNIKYTIHKYVSKKNHKSSRVYFYNFNNLTIFYNFLYNNYLNDLIGLRRKYDSWMLLFNSKYKYIQELKERKAVDKIFHIYYNARGRAYKLKTQWLLSRVEFKKLIDSFCYYCGCDASQYKNSKNTSFGHIIHRLNENLPFTLENSIPVCYFCSYCKQGKTHQEFLNYINRVTNNINNKNNISLFSANSCDNISQDLVLEKIKLF